MCHDPATRPLPSLFLAQSDLDWGRVSGAGSDCQCRARLLRNPFDPYPFDIRPCHIQLGIKRLPKPRYENVEEFRRAFFRADTELINFELV